MTNLKPDFDQAISNLRTGPRRLRRIAEFARYLGHEGVAYVDAIDPIEEAIWANGALPADTPRQQQAWRVTCDAARDAWEASYREFQRKSARDEVAKHIAAMRTPYNAFVDEPVDTSVLLDIELREFDAAHLIETVAMSIDMYAEDIVAVVGEVCPLPDNALRVAEFALEDFQRAPARRRRVAKEIAAGTYRETTPQQEHEEFLRECIEPVERRGVELPAELAELARESRAALAKISRQASDTIQESKPENALGSAPSESELTSWIDRLRHLEGRSPREAANALNLIRIGVGTGAEVRAAPVDLWQRYEAPDLPTGVLPKLIQRFAFGHAQVMGADPAGLAMSALCVCAAAINDEITVQVKQHDPTWRESARLWVGLVGMPSTKKTPIMSAAMAPLRRLDGALAQRNDEALRRYRALPKTEQTQAPQPKQPRHVVEDATVESLQQVIADSPHGLISIQDELTGWFGSMEKYNPGKGSAADRAFWLKGYNGGQYSVNRVMRGSALIPNLSFSVLGGIQPEPMRKIAGDCVDDGLIQRFLPVMLRPATVGRDVPSGDAVGAYEALVARLARLSSPRAGNLGPLQPLRFDAAARAVRERLEAEHADLVAALETVSPKLAAHFGKHDGIFARLCVVWHCVEHAEGALPLEIGANVAESVARFMVDFLRPNAISFYAGLLGMSAGHEEVMALASIIVSEGLTQVAARDVQRSSRALRGVTADDARKLCEKLAAFGWLEPMDPRTRSHTPRWRVIPEVHTIFAERGRQEAERRANARAAFKQVFGG